MATAEERVKILKMLEEGKLTADEAARLLKTLSKTTSPRVKTSSGEGSKWLRVRVTDLDGDRTSVNVNLPLELVHVGLRFGARFIPEVEGLDVDELDNALRQGLTGKVVVVVDEVKGERVEVFIE